MITFVSSTDFVISAQNLDRKRLWKQVLEAKQLLERLETLQFLSSIFNIPYPKRSDSTSHKYNYVRLIMKQLVKKGQTPIIKSGEIHYIEKQKKGMDRYDERLRIGHIYHLIVPLWINYENALRYYIHVHHIEWRRRGGNCKCSLESTESSVPTVYPPWLSTLVPAHCRILYSKSPSEYPQWSHLDPLGVDGAPWSEMYLCT